MTKQLVKRLDKARQTTDTTKKPDKKRAKKKLGAPADDASGTDRSDSEGKRKQPGSNKKDKKREPRSRTTVFNKNQAKGA